MLLANNQNGTCQDIVMAFSPPEYCRLFAQKKAYQGGVTGTPGPPPTYAPVCRRVCKCEPLLRFDPLNLAKIVCFAKWVKGAKCVSSDFLNEKVLMILASIIFKIKAQLNQLVNWKLWVALFYPEQ